MRVLENEYLEEYRRVGARRFEAGVTAAIRNHTTGFYPSMGEFLKFVPEAEDKSLDVKLAEWKAQYESEKDTPEFQAELAALKDKLKQLQGRM
jgi:hypothetical protein